MSWKLNSFRLKHFATDLIAAPVIPEPAVIARLLEGFSRVGKRPNPKKEGVNGEVLKEFIGALPFMDLSMFDVRLWTALFVTAYFGCSWSANFWYLQTRSSSLVWGE